jgi:hypothetical protein
MDRHPTLTDEAASIIHSESNQAAGSIVLPSHQRSALDLHDHGTPGDDTSELKHAVAKANVNSLPSTIPELNGHTGVVRYKVGCTDTKFAPVNQGNLTQPFFAEIFNEHV